MTALRTPPGPPAWPLVGNLPEFGRDALDFLLRLAREHGAVARFRLGPRTAYLISDPDAAKHVLQDHYKNYRKGSPYARARFAFGDGLITSDGEHWLRQRKLMQPVFHKQHFPEFARVMTRTIAEAIAGWQPGRPINLAHELRNLALAIATRSLFTTDVERDAGRVAQLFNQVNAWFSGGSKSGYLIPPWFPTPANLRLRQALAELDALVLGIIRARRQAATRPDDLLSLLMAARDEADGSAMSDRELRDEAMTLLFAAHETTGTTIAWVLCLLSKYPDVLARVAAEAARMLGGRTPEFEELQGLVYTKQVIEETMRLYPAGPIIPREVVADDEVGGYAIPAGSVVFLSPYVMHRDPARWDNPEAFDPERFRPEEVAQRHRFSYLPFVLGPRQCIGNHFALTEMLCAIPMIVSRFRFQLVPGLPIHAVHLRFQKGMWMTLSPAPDAAATRESAAV
jgi:cytochrome P450